MPLAHRFAGPFHTEAHGDFECTNSLEDDFNYEPDDGSWARGFYVLDATGLVIADIPFRNPNGFGFALLEKDEARVVASAIARLLTAEFARVEVN